MLNPNWLHTFCMLVETGHFTRTAEKLFMTQPGVSQHIRKLEQACGHALIRRENKSFELTEQGRLMYEYALDLRKGETRLLEKLSFDDPYSGVCRLACSGSLALLLYPALLDLQCQHPRLVPEVEAAPNQRILADVQQGKADIGIVTDVVNRALYEVQQVGSEPLCLILPGEFQGRSVDGDLLCEIGLIRHPDAEHYLSLYLQGCGDSALSRLDPRVIPQSGYVNQLSQILLPVVRGLGFTVLPQSALLAFSSPEQLFLHQPLHPVNEPRYLVTKRQRELPARFKQVMAVVSHCLDQATRATC
jgi:DNA-binding transcriptional LysR family regulator